MQPRRLPDDRFKKVRQVPKANTFRLFTAIFPPEEYIAYFRDVVRKLDKQKRNLKTTPLDQLHLTVRFIGAEVSKSSKEIIFEEFTKWSGTFVTPKITITGVQFGFPYQKDPQHVLAALEPTKELQALYDSIHERLKILNLEDTIRWKGKNSDNFHITIARLKPHKSRGASRDLGELVKNVNVVPPEPFIADRIELVESDVTAGQPIYRRLGSIKL